MKTTTIPHCIVIFVVSCYSFIGLHGQTTNPVLQEKVISILEKDRDGKYLKNNVPKESFRDNKIVDINSVLQIDLDYNAIVSKIKENTSGLPSDIDQKIKLLSEALKDREQVLNQFDDLLQSYNYEEFKANPAKNEEWANKMQGIAFTAVKLTFVSQYIAGIGDVGFRPADIYQRATTELERMTTQVESFADKQGVYVQLGGWLYKKNSQSEAIHLPGFDSIAPKPPYEVERWQILPTEEQLKQLEDATALAQSNKDKGLSILKEMINIQVQQLQQLLDNGFNELITKIESQISTITDARINPFLVDFKKFKTDLESFKTELIQRISFYKNLNIDNETSVVQLMSQVQNDIKFITEGQGKALYEEASNLYDQAKALVTTTITNVNNLDVTIDKIKVFLSQWIATVIGEDNYNKIKELLMGTPVDFAVLHFSDQVFKLSLANMPTQSDLDLFTTGIRSSGDRIALKFEINSKKKLIYRENREVYMYKVLPHIEGTVGVVFADPLSNTAVKTQFQMAPYYNLILKGLWDQKLRRKSVTYNRIFDWGIGLHISAPDFDADDVPELGTGIVVSFLHDYVQSGAAINVFTGDPYWFFGLRLPVPSFNIGAAPNTSN